MTHTGANVSKGGGGEASNSRKMREKMERKAKAKLEKAAVAEPESDDEVPESEYVPIPCAGNKMCVVAFDLSQDTFRMATVLGDKASYGVKEIPPAMLFIGKQRFVGKATTGKEGLFYDIMKLIGKDSPDMSSVPNVLACLEKNPETNLLSVRLPGLDHGCQFTATHLLAMVLSEMKDIAEGGLDRDVKVHGYCIGVPTYFTKLQRLAVNQAAEIAGLHGVSIMNATTAIALSAGVTFPSIWKKGGHIAIVDVGDTVTQVSIVHLKKKAALKVRSYSCDHSLGEKDFLEALCGNLREESSEYCRELIDKSKELGNINLEYGGKEMTLELFAKFCEPLLNQMNVLVQKALEQANLKKGNLSDIFLAGSGCLIRPISSTLQKRFGPGPKRHSELIRGGVAMGCAMSCAIQRKKEFKECHPDEMDEDEMKFLLDRYVIDKLSSPVQNESTVDGRVELTQTEIRAARDKEVKMLLPIRVRDKLDSMRELEGFMQSEEHNSVERHNSYILDADKLNEYLSDVLKGDGVEVYNQYTSMLLELDTIKEKIMARKNEHENKDDKINDLRTKIKDYIDCVLSNSEVYSRIKQDAKDEFKSICDETEQWLANKETVLAKMSKRDDAINFLGDAAYKIEMLQKAWLKTLEKRDPEIVNISFNVADQEYLEIIDEYRETVKTNHEIEGCYMLPLQIQHLRVPNTYIKVKLQGRNDDHVTLTVIRYNSYIAAFANKNGALYELGDGRKDREYVLSLFKDKDAKYAGFHCDYFSMVDIKGKKMKTTEVCEFLETFILNHELLLDSIHVAAYYKIESHTCDKCAAEGAIERALMRISFMLNEPARMKLICDNVHNGKEFVGKGFIRFLMEFIWIWGDISKAVRRWDGTTTTIPGWLKSLLDRKQLTHVKYMSQLFDILYLVLNEVPDGVIPWNQLDPSEQPPTSDGQPGDDGDSNHEQAPPPSPAAPADGGEPDQSSDSGNYDGKYNGKAMNRKFKELTRKMKNCNKRLRKDSIEKPSRDGDKNLPSELNREMQVYYLQQKELVHAQCRLEYFRRRQQQHRFMIARYEGMLSGRREIRIKPPRFRGGPSDNSDKMLIICAELEEEKANERNNQQRLARAEMLVAAHYRRQVRNIKRIEAYLERHYRRQVSNIKRIEAYLERHSVPAATTSDGCSMTDMEGQILAEIFAVFVDPVLADEISCIVVHDDSGSHIIYKYDDIGYVETEKTYAGRVVRGLPSIKNKIALPLSGPWVAISCAEGCTLEFFPKNQNSHGTSDGLSRREDNAFICLDQGSLSCNQHNQKRLKTATFGGGKLHVSYAVWTGAVQAYVEIWLCAPFLKRPNIDGFVGAHHLGSAEAVSRLFEQMPSVPVTEQPFLSKGKQPYISVVDKFEDDDLQSTGLIQLATSIDVPLLQSIISVKLGTTVTFEGMLNVNGVDIEVATKLNIPSEIDISSNVCTQWIGCGGGLSYQVKMHLTKRFILPGAGAVKHYEHAALVKR